MSTWKIFLTGHCHSKKQKKKQSKYTAQIKTNSKHYISVMLVMLLSDKRLRIFM